ncbi:MAG: GNAT family N-acetyltransferase [Candidatus Obscuribacterales bacterium]|nr:GNAT family N-acetyltransferase [Candidatus Obscuribacterales bacterium]
MLTGEKAKSQLALSIERTHFANARCYAEINATSLWQTESMTGSRAIRPVEWLNSVFTYNRPGGVPVNELEELVERFRPDSFTWYLGVMVEEPDMVRRSLLDFGFVHADTHVCMTLTPENFKTKADIADFEVICMSEEYQVRDWLTPTEVAFEFPPDAYDCLDTFVRSDLETTHHEPRFVGYYRGQPVSSCSYFVHEGQPVIYWVGTLPEFRLRGFARKVVEAAVAHCFSNHNAPVALYATEMGAPVYKAIGFEPLYNQYKFVYTPVV